MHNVNTQRANSNWYTPETRIANYVTITDASLGYYKLKLNKRSSYITTFACKLQRYRFTRLASGVTPAAGMFQCKIDRIFKVMPNVFGTADDISIVEYNSDERDHNGTLIQIVQICHQQNLKVNKNKCHFRCPKTPLFGEVTSREGVQPSPKKLCKLTKKFPIIKGLNYFLI